jgi:hypothetical protein
MIAPASPLRAGARARPSGSVPWVRPSTRTERLRADYLEDIETLHLLGGALADGTQWPNWAADSPYRARRCAVSSRSAL